MCSYSRMDNCYPNAFFKRHIKGNNEQFIVH